MIHNDGLMLICRVRTCLCALPLEHVAEAMRPLPIEPMPNAPLFIRGLAILRGKPVPVVDAGRLLGAAGSKSTRFVALKLGDRRVALAVDGVIGVRSIPAESLHALPPLLRDAGAETLSEIGTLDAQLLLVLRSACFVPEDLWTQFGERELS